MGDEVNDNESQASKRERFKTTAAFALSGYNKKGHATLQWSSPEDARIAVDISGRLTIAGRSNKATASDNNDVVLMIERISPKMARRMIAALEAVIAVPSRERSFENIMASPLIIPDEPFV